MKKYSVFIVFALCSSMFVYASDFYRNINVKWDTSRKELPVQTMSFTIEEEHISDSYIAYIEYPEYVKLTETEKKFFETFSYSTADTIVVSQYLGISRKKGILDLSFVPVVKRDNILYRLVSGKMVVKSHPLSVRSKSRTLASSNDRYVSSSVLSTGKWVKVRVKEEGVYSLSASYLSSLGFKDISKVKVYGYGGKMLNNIINYANTPDGDYDDLEEVPLYRREKDVLFYAEGTRKWTKFSYSSLSGNYLSKHINNPYSSYSYYFITEGDDPMSLQDENPAQFTTRIISSVPSQAVIDNDEYSWYTSGRNLYEAYNYAEHGSRRKYSLSLPGIDTTRNAVMTVSFSSSSSTMTLLSVEANGTSLGNMSISSTSSYDHAVSVEKSFITKILRESSAVTLKTTTGVDARLDFIRVDYNRHLEIADKTLTFSDYSNTAGTFQISNGGNTFKVWRLGYPGHPTSNIPVSFDNGFIQCAVDNPSLRYVAVDVSAAYDMPEVVGSVANQDLHADSSYTMVIVIPSSGKLLKPAEKLAKHHEEKDGLKVKVVRADQIYNEFSSGTPDACAYRRYMKMLYDRAENEEQMPKYLLLFGSCVWDNRMITTECSHLSPEDYLLCYESEASLNEVSSYVSDDYFGLLDDNEGNNLLSEKIDLGIGRFPVTTQEQANILVDKTISYAENKTNGAWKNDIYVIADDGDNNEHMSDAEKLVNVIEEHNPKMSVKRVYLDAYQSVTSSTGKSYPSVRSKLQNVMNTKGALVMNYTGHGAPYQITVEQVLKLEDFKNAMSPKLPLWVVAACIITPYDMLQESIGETSLMNKNSAAVAFYSSSRPVYSTQNSFLNNYFMEYVLKTDESGRRFTLGDAAMHTKVSLVTVTDNGSTDLSYNKLKYALMGDPALTLTMPEYDVVLDSINGQPVNDPSKIRQLKAGSIANVKGHIERDGLAFSDFKGKVNVTLMDSKDTVQCFNNPNDDVTPFSYSEYTKILYEGNDSVRNGAFSMQIPVPLDIKYTNLNGKMSLYAVSEDNKYEANGVSYDFIVGGTDLSGSLDNNGPDIQVFLNSWEFKDGGNVNTTPQFIALLNDSDGINATGNGAGHNMEVIIDNKENLTYNVNNYYVNDFGSYTSGTLSFPIPELEEGDHQLLFRAWDMKNNSSTASLNFRVVENLKPSILKVSLSKNPASTYTDFIIDYDRPETETQVSVYVYDNMGHLWYKTYETATSSTGQYIINWDLRSNNGVNLPDGLYLYQVGVSCKGSKKSTQTEKLIIHRQ